MKINKLLSLERSLVCGLLLMITSISLTICSLATWRDKEFLFLEPNETMRLVIPAVTCAILAVNVSVNGFFLTLLNYLKKDNK